MPWNEGCCGQHRNRHAKGASGSRRGSRGRGVRWWSANTASAVKSNAGEVERDLLIVLTWKDEEFVGFVSWDLERAQEALYGRYGVISPAHRGAKLSTCGMQLGEVIARAMGVGFIYTLATLKVASMQLALERAGYQLVGVAPGYDRELTASGVVKRVYEACYAKVLVPEDELQRPDPAKMTPKTRQLFELLFPHLLNSSFAA